MIKGVRVARGVRSFGWRRVVGIISVIVAGALCRPRDAAAQDLVSLVKDVQHVSIATYCWEWQEPLEGDCTFGGGLGIELGYAVRPIDLGDFGLELDLGFGFTESNAFALVTDSIRVTGVARERPAVSICLAGGYKVITAVFLCGRTGFFDLHETQAWDSTAVTTSNSFTGSGSIFQLGGSLGIAVGYEPLLFTAQVSRMSRRFDVVTWKGEAQKTLPQDLPRTLDLSGYGIVLGLTIQLKDP